MTSTMLQTSNTRAAASAQEQLQASVGQHVHVETLATSVVEASAFPVVLLHEHISFATKTFE